MRNGPTSFPSRSRRIRGERSFSSHPAGTMTGVLKTLSRIVWLILKIHFQVGWFGFFSFWEVIGISKRIVLSLNDFGDSATVNPLTIKTIAFLVSLYYQILPFDRYGEFKFRLILCTTYGRFFRNLKIPWIVWESIVLYLSRISLVILLLA